MGWVILAWIMTAGLGPFTKDYQMFSVSFLQNNGCLVGMYPMPHLHKYFGISYIHAIQQPPLPTKPTISMIGMRYPGFTNGAQSWHIAPT